MDANQITDLYQSSDTRLKAAQLAVNQLRNNVFDEISDGSYYRDYGWWLGALFYETHEENRLPVIEWIVQALEDNPQFETVSYKDNRSSSFDGDLAWWYGRLWYRTDEASENRITERIINLLENNPQFETVSYKDNRSSSFDGDLAWWKARL